MSIVKVQARLVTLQLAEPYTIAYETFSSASNVVILLHTDQGVIGCGCSAPEQAVTGETPESVLQGVLDSAGWLRDTPSDELGSAVTRLRDRFPEQPALCAGLDMALHDLRARELGVPVYALLGAHARPLLTSITIGIASVTETLAKAMACVDKGFRSLKVKGGLSVEQDIERILKIRESVGPGVTLRFDANQGYSLEDTRRFLRQVREANLEVLEQPVPAQALDLMKQLCEDSCVPIMADESLVSLEDATRLVSGPGAHAVNLKLMKNGGIIGASRIRDMATSAGLTVMVGCMDELALGIVAALHFALTCGPDVLVDLDGHLDVLDDPTAGAVRLEQGRLMPAPEPGLGIDPARLTAG